MYFQSCSNFRFLLSQVLLGIHTLFVLHHRGYVHRYLSMYKCPMITLIPPPHHPLCLFVCRASMINRGLCIVLLDSAYDPTTHGKPLWCNLFARTVHPLLHNRDRLHSSYSSGQWLNRVRHFPSHTMPYFPPCHVFTFLLCVIIPQTY